MKIHKIKISEDKRGLISDFMDEEIPNEIDFNLLMQVVEKIERLGFPTNIRADYLRHNLDYSMEIFSRGDGNLLIENDFGYESKIDCVLDSVVGFIKWNMREDSLK